MSFRKHSQAELLFEPAVLLGGAGYGAWTECNPNDPALARRLAEAFTQVEYIWTTAPEHERAELVDWLISQWKIPTSADEGRG